MKTKQDIILWIIAVILLLAILSYTVYSISFLARAVNSVFREEAGREALIVKFDFEKFNKVLEGRLRTNLGN